MQFDQPRRPAVPHKPSAPQFPGMLGKFSINKFQHAVAPHRGSEQHSAVESGSVMLCARRKNDNEGLHGMLMAFILNQVTTLSLQHNFFHALLHMRRRCSKRFRKPLCGCRETNMNIMPSCCCGWRLKKFWNLQTFRARNFQQSTIMNPENMPTIVLTKEKDEKANSPNIRSINIRTQLRCGSFIVAQNLRLSMRSRFGNDDWEGFGQGHSWCEFGNEKRM